MLKKIISSCLLTVALIGSPAYAVDPVLKSCFDFGNKAYVLAYGNTITFDDQEIHQFFVELGEFYKSSVDIKDPEDLQVFVTGRCIALNGDYKRIIPSGEKPNAERQPSSKERKKPQVQI